MSVRPSIRVLLVEDSLANQKVLRLLLEKQGCVVSVAIDGAEGVDQYAEDEFDIVFMDVQMPVMDGLTATRIIRHHEIGIGRRAMIVAVTAGVPRQRCLDAGMDDHMLKPVRPDKIHSILQRWRVTAVS